MKKTTVELTGEVELTYDENSPEFNEALLSYMEVIDNEKSYKNVEEKQEGIKGMLLHVAFYVTRFGTDTMVEGVGYVGYNGRKPNDSPDSGIMVMGDYDDYEFYAKGEK